MTMTRRNLIGSSSVLAVSGLATSGDAATPQQSRKMFVLVHGAWHGGWCWRDVAAILRSHGHLVYCPTLTGLGERKHLAQPSTNLSTHIADIANLLEYEETFGAILVGHSYGGLVISGAAARMPQHVGKLVYLDAILPVAGVSSTPDKAKLDERRATAINGFLMPPPEAGAVVFGIDPADGAAIAWVNRRLTPQPVESFAEPYPVGLTPPSRPRMYIRCTEPGFAMMAGFAEEARHDPSWTYRELATGHDAMVSMPQPLAQHLLDWA